MMPGPAETPDGAKFALTNEAMGSFNSLGFMDLEKLAKEN